jgi:predicted permease
MVLRPLNVREPATLLRFHRRSPQQYAYALPYPEAVYFRERSRALSAVLLLNSTRVSVNEEPKQRTAHFVSANYFSELGAIPAAGRLIDPTRDDSPRAEPVVVLSHKLWQREFGSDPLIVGRVIRLNSKPATIVGVASSAFGGLSLDDAALWAPVTQHPYFVSGSKLLTDYSLTSGVQMSARLQPGYSAKTAEKELALLAADLRHTQPEAIWENEALPSEPAGYAKSLRFANSRGTGQESGDQLYRIVFLMAALVLLILAAACANLGSLLLARGVARQREIAIRVFIGAGTARLIRQLLTESVLLAMLGSAAGLLVGFFTLRSLMDVAGAPRSLDPTPDWRIVLFAVGVGLAAVVLFGLAPAWQVARQRHRATATRQILVAAQVAASCVLLIVGALLTRALGHASSADPGFNYQQLISIEPGLSKHGWSPAQASAYLDVLQARLRAVPGIDSVCLALTPPLGHVSMTAGLQVEGRPLSVQMNRVDLPYFTTMQIPLLRGRNLTRGGKSETVVSQSLAQLAWPGQDPLGKTLPLDEGYTVVGVAASARSVKLEDSDAVEAYMPLEPADLPSAFVLVRTSGKTEDLARSVASTGRSIDRNIFPEVELVKAGLERKLESARYTALAVSMLGLIAHLLACIGILGVVAYAVSQRTKEIGIRMALGAKPAEMLGNVLRQFLAPVATGTLLGVAAAAGFSHLLRSVLYGISNFDPLTYLLTITLFILTVLIAALFPATRVLTINPLRALRYE